MIALTYILHDSIFVDFRRGLDLEFSWSNMEFAVSQQKKVDCHEAKKQT